MVQFIKTVDIKFAIIHLKLYTRNFRTQILDLWTYNIKCNVMWHDLTFFSGQVRIWLSIFNGISLKCVRMWIVIVGYVEMSARYHLKNAIIILYPFFFKITCSLKRLYRIIYKNTTITVIASLAQKSWVTAF